jgi:hypothetical protein
MTAMSEVTWDDISRRIDNYRGMTANWDSHGAVPPTCAQIDKAQEFCRVFRNLGFPVPRAVPLCPDGHVGFEWDCWGSHVLGDTNGEWAVFESDYVNPEQSERFRMLIASNRPAPESELELVTTSKPGAHIEVKSGKIPDAIQKKIEAALEGK